VREREREIERYRERDVFTGLPSVGYGKAEGFFLLSRM
jgi:hypothetical protein